MAIAIRCAQRVRRASRAGSLATSATSRTASSDGISHGTRDADSPGSHSRAATVKAMKTTSAATGGQRDSPSGSCVAFSAGI